jgi:hypothetical protein
MCLETRALRNVTVELFTVSRDTNECICCLNAVDNHICGC